ncbi:MAG: tRNA (adenosine(37)-N6)-threonylcarbamoyltransferase complex ATPase subunit type 1 TsaE [Parcubacteria group bacterium]
MRIKLSNQQQTQKLGRWLATKLAGGQVVSLEGPLGAGKTTLLQGIAKGLGLKVQLTSPTFILFRNLTLPRPAGVRRSIKYLVQADAYRIKNPGELVATGFPEFVGQPQTLVVVEWGDRVLRLLPKDTLRIKLSCRRDGRSVILPKIYQNEINQHAR